MIGAATPIAEHLTGLLPHHLAALRTRGLNDETIKASGIYSETSPDNLARILNWRKPRKALAPAIVIPFTGPDGQNGFARVRPDTPRTLAEKPVKYESPKDGGVRVYYPPAVLKRPATGLAENGIVKGILENPAIELAVTEGEFKSLAVTQSAMPCIGLGGVYGWKEKRGEKLLPELERITWNGRKVTIIFDSDIDRNPDVQTAECRLAKCLMDRGAIVVCVRIPDGPTGDDGQPTKWGVDDFLAAKGAAALQALLKDAIEPDPVEADEGKLDAGQLEPSQMADRFLASRQSDGLVHLRFHRGGYWLWRGGRYIELEPSDVRSELILTINRDFNYLTTGITSNVMAQVQAQSTIPSRVQSPAWLDQPPFDWPPHEVLATRRQLVHLPSLVSGDPHTVDATPRFFSPTALEFEFSIDAPPPELWLRFLSQLWPSDQESIRTLAEWFGYVLTLDTSLQKILMLIGPPRSGKGTIARVLESLIGRENVAGPTLASLEGTFGLQPLLGKSLAVVSDARLGGRVDQHKVVERLLSVSGEDTLTVDRKHRESVTGRIPARLMIVSNELPKLAESSGALTNRMIVLQLENSFLGSEDTQLTNKLKAELPGILLWAIKGWERLRDRGHFVQPRAGRELAEEMGDLSSPVGAFVRQRCMVGKQYSAQVNDVYGAWVGWCRLNGREHPGTKQSFGRDLRSAVPGLTVDQHREAGDRFRAYQGLGLKPQEDR